MEHVAEFFAYMDGFVTSCHPGENRGPERLQAFKMMDSGLRRNDGKRAFGTSYEGINIDPEENTQH
jgi:hypothetical protein